MFSITETINSRSDEIEVTPGFDYLTLILTCIKIYSGY